MKRAVEKSPKVNLECMGKKIASLFDSKTMVSLVKQRYIDRNIKPKVGPAKGLEAILHILFDLKGANGGEIPMTKNFAVDITFLGLKVPKVWFLVIKDPNELLGSKKKTKLPGIMRWNTMKLV